MGQQHLSIAPEKETNAVDQPIAADLPPKALARKLVDAAVAEAEADEDEECGLFINCDLGKVAHLNVVVTHNEMDGAQVEIWDSEESWRSLPNFCLDADDVSALIKVLAVAKFATKMLHREHGPGWGHEAFPEKEALEAKPAI